MTTLHDPTVLPADLPPPPDDGAARHLTGMRLPSLRLAATDGSHVDLGVYWKGNSVSINGEVKDTAGDGRSAVVEIRYQVYYSGAWHTHYRYPAKASGNGAQGLVYSQRSRYPARSVVARACVSNNGKIVTCDPHWR